MKINVIDADTGNELFSYQSSQVPRMGEIVVENDETGIGLQVEAVKHIIHPGGIPYVELHCKIV